MPAMRRRAALTAFFSMAAAFTGPPARAAASKRDVAAVLEQVFSPLVAEHQIPGLAVGLTLGGERHFACFGRSSPAGGDAVTADTLFEIGSLSKVFTATLGALAVERRWMHLEEHPGRYVPQLRGTPVDRATLLHLGTYTAGGLPLQFPEAVTQGDMLSYFRGWQAAAAPGSVRQYSNPSIGLFGHVAAQAAGRDFTELMEREVFAGLGLSSTFLRVPPGAMPRYAWGVDKAGRAIRVNPGVLDAQAYGVKSTANDLVRLLELNLQPDQLGRDLRSAVAATQTGYFDTGGMVQGLGWEQYAPVVRLADLLAGNAPAMALQPHAVRALAPPRKADAGTWFNKTGSTNGFGAYAAFVPERRAGLVLLANRNFPNEARVRAAQAVLEAVA